MKKFVFTALSAALMLIGSNAFAQLSVNAGFTNSALKEKAKKQGVKVRLSIYEGMFHVFQMAMLMMPESKRAWAEVGKFIEMISE